jgi:hypothetical protein
MLPRSNALGRAPRSQGEDTLRRTTGLLAVLVAVLALAPTPSGAAVRPGTKPAAEPAPNTYPVVLSGDFTGDREADLFFHSPSTAPDVLYELNPENDPDFVDIYTFSVQGGYRPVVGDFAGGGTDDIFWYQPGTGADVIWSFDFCNGCDQRPTYKRFPQTVNGIYTPLSMGRGSVLWYGRGSIPDSMWTFNSSCSTCAPTKSSRSLSVRGSSYEPVAGDFLGSPGSGREVFWYNPTGPETMWTFDYSWHPQSIASPALNVVGSTYELAVSDLFADQWDDIVFVGPGAATDSVWDFYDDHVSKLAPPEPMNLDYRVVTGIPLTDFEDPGGWFVYDPTALSGSLFDVQLADGAPETPYVRHDFEPAPLTEGPPAAGATSATSDDVRIRRWPAER